MGINKYPIPSSGSSTSTVLPVNASSVILDGSLTSAGTYTATVNGNGSPAYLVANVNSATITVGGTAYSVPANTVVASKAFGASTSVTVAASYAQTAPATFTSSTMPSGGSAVGWTSVAYGNGYFVAVAFGTTAGAYSTDGINWTASTMPSASNWKGVTYGNGYYVAVSESTTAGAYSTNGTTWTASTMPSSAAWLSVAYGLIGATNYYVAVQESSTTAGASSTNGTTWTARTMPSASTWQSVTFGNGYFVAVQASGTTAGAYSTNGTSWTASTMPSGGSAVGWSGVTYGLVGTTPTFVAVAPNTTAGAYSTNGSTWTASTMPSSSPWWNVTYGNGYFVAVATGTAGAYSINGTTWTALTMPSSSGWFGVTYGNGYFVAVQGSGTTAGAYFAQTALLPVNFGIYAGPTTVN